MSIVPCLIEHCSPTLASLKMGSLFSFVSPNWKELYTEAAALNRELKAKGLTLCIIRINEQRALCYLYRPLHLGRMLSDPACAAFLRTQGYDCLSVSAAIAKLCTHLSKNSEFPHEIGLFLGYPLADVIGFIENKGKNCVCCGCWKAYTDACTAQRLFVKLNKCTEVYRRLYQAGRTLNQLTVAA